MEDMTIKNFNVKISDAIIIAIGAHTESEAIELVKARYSFMIKECEVDPNSITIEYKRDANKRFT